MIELHFLSASFVFLAAGIPIYLSFRLSGMLRILTVTLATFAVIHGFYHIAEIYGNDFLGHGLLEPLSVGVLMVFGIIFLNLKRQMKVEAGKRVARP